MLIDGHKQAVLPIVPECPFAFGGFGRQRKTLSNDEFDRVTQKDRRAAPAAADGGPSRICGRQLVQTFIDFMPVSASVRVLKVPLSTMVVVVVVGFLSTMVHFFVAVSRTT